MMSVTKNPHTATNKFFFEGSLLDWPIHLRPWTAL